MNNMTKRLPQIQNYRPYKYQEVRRKFRTEVKGGKNIGSIQEEDAASRPVVSRERTNLAISNSNLGVSRENLGASQDSLNRDEASRAGTVKNPIHGSHENLRANIAQRQTSLENLKRREENGKHVYSFSLQKADRSYSEPVLFPPVGERKSKTSQGNKLGGGASATMTPQVYVPHNGIMRENTLNSVKQDKKQQQFPVKFPIVSRSDLYKHLGIAPDGRKKKRLDDNSKNTGASRGIRDSNYGLPKHILQILPESGGSRHTAAALSSNMYGRDAEAMPKNKVEMYKQWHEEQSRKRTTALTNNTNTNKRPAQLQSEVTKDAVRLASIYRDKYTANDMRTRQQQHQSRGNREGTLPKIGGVYNHNANNRSNVPSRAAADTILSTEKGVAGSSRPESAPAPIPEELKNRVYSAKTWKTWRDMNTSYSYVDVKEYIEDNELMDEEKEEWIKDWIIDVDRKYFHPTPEDSDEEEEVVDQSEKNRVQMRRNSQSDKGTPQKGERQGTGNGALGVVEDKDEAQEQELIAKAEGITKL